MGTVLKSLLLMGVGFYLGKKVTCDFVAFGLKHPDKCNFAATVLRAAYENNPDKYEEIFYSIMDEYYDNKEVTGNE